MTSWVAPVSLHATVLRRRTSSYRRLQPLSGFTGTDHARHAAARVTAHRPRLGLGLGLGTVDNGAPSWGDSSCGRGGRGVTSTVESGSKAVPAAERPAEPEQQERERELGSAADTGCRSDVVQAGRPRRILVASLATGMGTTTIAALLGSVLATTRAGSVRALDATPHPGRLAARLLPPPASEHDGPPARLEVRTIDPAAVVCAAEQAAGDDVTVVDLGAELTAAARSGLLGWADRLVFVRSDSGEAGPGQAIPGP